MPAKNADLHGNVPDQCPVALILIDTINDLDFSGGRELLETALPAAKKLAALKARAKAAKVPVIYVNDNFGKWRSDFHQQLEHVIGDHTLGAPIAELLKPDDDDYFVLKAKHSGFYHTQLDLLIAYLDTKRIILTGFTTDICVLFTASDAHMRDLEVIVPRDCVAATKSHDHRHTLNHMERVLGVRVVDSMAIDFAELAKEEPSREKSEQFGSQRNADG
jgi:nicotinamidase-related amidase